MKPGGRIINVSTVMTNLGSYKLIVYNASKAAVNSMTLSVSEELGPKGITVNTVSPGTPQEVANAILFLASPMSSYITGQVTCVDGGINLPL
jgi:3-oxoacyl-[acyl-carrier protein] reductase